MGTLLCLLRRLFASLARNCQVLLACALIVESVERASAALLSRSLIGFATDPATPAGLAYHILVSFPLTGGYIGVALLAARRREPHLRDFLLYFKRWFGFSVSVLPLYLVIYVIPATALVAQTQLRVVWHKSVVEHTGVLRAFYDHASRFVDVAEFLLVNSPIICVLLFFAFVPWLFAPVCYADGRAGAFGSILTSRELMKRSRSKYYGFAVLFLAVLLVQHGFIALVWRERADAANLWSAAARWLAGLVFAVFNIQLLVEAYLLLGADGDSEAEPAAMV
ncbi:MAG TPA: hypothetical protein ENF73_02950 [Proteobacteria bacterium]|nr:hypothetical protein [Pseudomonadota bacterium]